MWSELRAKCVNSGGSLHLKDFWAEFAVRDRLLRDFCSSRRSTRLAHLSRSITFLRQHNVVPHSALFLSPSKAQWTVSKDFSRVMTLGCAHLRSEVSLRIAKAFPEIPTQTFASVLRQVTDRANLALLYDELHLNRLCPPERRTIRVSEEQKACVLTALVGEMQWFASRTKATERTHNNALFPPSDILILHVLCTHAVESTTVESLYRVVQGDVARTAASWRNFHCSTAEQLRLKPRCPGKLSVTCIPRPRPNSCPSSPNEKTPAFVTPSVADGPTPSFVTGVPLKRPQKVFHTLPDVERLRLSWSREVLAVAPAPVAHTSTFVNPGSLPPDEQQRLLFMPLKQ